MLTPNEIINELKNAKQAINLIEIRGEQNANNMLYACQKCDMVIAAIQQILEDSQKRKEQKNDDAEADE